MNTQPEVKHTALPWKFEQTTKTIRQIPSNCWIASVDSWDGLVNNNADSEFIIRACNSHYELLEALKRVKLFYQSYGYDESTGASSYKAICQAIEKAEGSLK